MFQTVCHIRKHNGVKLIWDTGAAEHLFSYVPTGSSTLRNKSYKVFLGGSSDHGVNTSKVFDCGFLRDVLLLPYSVQIDCSIISAGKLKGLRTIQSMDGKFYVVSNTGVVISKGIVGPDMIFYLSDDNLLKDPKSVRCDHRLSVSLIPNT
jgi:hypothetical protein